MNEKVTGYILLILGASIMVFCAANVVLVFTKYIEPVKLFNFEGVSIDLSSMVPTLQKISESKKTEIISSAIINDTSNIAAHVFLMGFLVGIGNKIAVLGITLLRPIEVKLRAKDGTSIPTNT